MDKYKFIERIKKSGIDQNMQDFQKALFSPVDKLDKSETTHLRQVFQSWDEAQQQFFLFYIKIVVEDSVGFILSVLDGATNMGDSGGQFQLYYDEEDGQRTHINDKDGDMLMTLFMDEDEDEVTN